mgnify:CR=1 FL=1
MKNKKNIIFWLVSAICIVVAVALFLVAGYLKGWDIAGWFSSSMAIWCYFIVGIYLIALLIMWLWGKYKKW